MPCDSFSQHINQDHQAGCFSLIEYRFTTVTAKDHLWAAQNARWLKDSFYLLHGQGLMSHAHSILQQAKDQVRPYHPCCHMFTV